MSNSAKIVDAHDTILTRILDQFHEPKKSLAEKFKVYSEFFLNFEVDLLKFGIYFKDFPKRKDLPDIADKKQGFEKSAEFVANFLISEFNTNNLSPSSLFTVDQVGLIESLIFAHVVVSELRNWKEIHEISWEDELDIENAALSLERGVSELYTNFLLPELKVRPILQQLQHLTSNTEICLGLCRDLL